MQSFNLKAKRKTDYFEGWYFRYTDEANHLNFALIFAETLYAEDPHAFIQIFDDVAQTNDYLKFPLSAFSFSQDTVMIDKNALSLHHVTLHHKDLHINLSFTNHDYMEKRSAMGFLSKLPLQCYQEVIFLNADVSGTIEVDGKTVKTSGKGYMEKTYGRRFPERWFWLQANHFLKPASFTLAGGTVPTLFFRKFGFFLIIHALGKEYVFATYNFARFSVSIQDDGWIVFKIRKGRYTAIIEAKQINPVRLVGPTDFGKMNLDVLESIQSQVKLTLIHKHTRIFEDSSLFAGFEWMFE